MSDKYGIPLSLEQQIIYKDWHDACPPSEEELRLNERFTATIGYGNPYVTNDKVWRVSLSNTLVVWRLDRLGRSLKDLVEIVNGLEEREIGFKSLTESIDTTSAGGRLVFHLFGALAEFERNLISDRTKAGLAAARARGRKGGRKPKMTKADIKKAAAMLKDPSITKTEVAKHFGVSRVTLNASLKRVGYPENPAQLQGKPCLI